MVNFNFLGALVAIAGLAAAAPTSVEVAERAPQEYHLKTKVISGDPKMDDLYGIHSFQILTQNITNSHTVVGYHTGAGLGDATLTSNITYASKGFLNGTYQQFDYNTPFPWGMKLAYDMYYTRWQACAMSTAIT